MKTHTLIVTDLWSGVTGFHLPINVKRLASRVYRPVRPKLWPYTLSDLNVQAPLPPGPLGCPFVGLNPKLSSPSFEPGLLGSVWRNTNGFVHSRWSRDVVAVLSCYVVQRHRWSRLWSRGASPANLMGVASTPATYR
jgi:hypothetical protein